MVWDLAFIGSSPIFDVITPYSLVKTEGGSRHSMTLKLTKCSLDWPFCGYRIKISARKLEMKCKNLVVLGNLCTVILLVDFYVVHSVLLWFGISWPSM